MAQESEAGSECRPQPRKGGWGWNWAPGTLPRLTVPGSYWWLEPAAAREVAYSGHPHSLPRVRASEPDGRVACGGSRVGERGGAQRSPYAKDAT